MGNLSVRIVRKRVVKQDTQTAAAEQAAVMPSENASVSSAPGNKPSAQVSTPTVQISKPAVQSGQKVTTKITRNPAGRRFKEVERLWKERGSQEALPAAQRALDEFPNDANLLNLTALLLMQAKRHPEAEAVFCRIPNYAGNAAVLTNLGYAALQQKHYDQAADYFRKALAVNPQHVTALLNMGVLSGETGDRAAAVDYYERALAVSPQNTQALFNLAVSAKERDLREACDYYRRLLDIDPTHTNALGNWAFFQNYLTPYDPERIAREIAYYARRCAEALRHNLPPAVAADSDKKLHIGLVTADLQQGHPVGYFLQGLLTAEAVKQFDWSAYLNAAHDDKLTRQVRPLFKHWHNIQAWSDKKAMGQIRSDGIDILIDLSGYTAHNRAGIFTAQTAPVQLEWLGWFATIGLPAMNGIIADPYCVPPGEEFLYTEKVWRLPHTRLCMQPLDTDDKTPPLPPSLQNGYMTFGCFQNPLKIGDEVLAVWAKIAKARPDARWQFKGKGQEVGTPLQQRIQAKLESFGFKPEQMDFSGKIPRAQFLQAHHDIDLILDTFPYPGGTTTAIALWMAVPTLTLTGQGMLARQGEQFMRAAGFSELVCQNTNEYIEKALYWSAPENRAKLTALRADIYHKARRSPVFDTKKFADDWCQLMREIWRDACFQTASN
ncbi:putative O-linked N-acetylglucosamine transferase (SPINDLY family) [Neisseria perflava]|uniref:O-linked N-acetylglucosamine transferase, SPINDLY family protein n=1 Tax=Neisseria perflava TaxID=33053 RepID=UPI00209FC6FA|nr:glycosyltransferase family 41 protein [Neisseria perflava]MCP1772791.1 putative O-linked N-acetylglucosamine transferase (SPINDLY family) [Neisseria perflava]